MILWGCRDAYQEGDVGHVLTAVDEELREDGHIAVADALRVAVDSDLDAEKPLKSLVVRQDHNGNGLWYGHLFLGNID
jgi:hypothetical protein